MRHTTSVILATLAMVIPSLTMAQTQTAPILQFQSLAITPFLIEATIQPGQNSTHEITLTNTGDTDLPVDISINDFVPEEKTGQPRFLDSSETSNPRFSISSWIKITKQPQYLIAPHSSSTMQFIISAPNDAEPGTHYGGILFTYNPTMNSVPGGSQVTEKVGTIILAKLGKSQDKGAITEFYGEGALNDAQQINFNLTFHNYGNAHTRPKGEIFISNIFGQPVTEAYVNEDANIVLPDSERTFNSKTQQRLGIGRYKATAVLYYGSPRLEIRSTMTFWVWPWKRVLTVTALVILFGLVSFFGLKRYNHWIINRSL